MRTAIMIGMGLLVAFATPGEAAKAPGKTAPVCSAIRFRPLPPGTPDGDQPAGMYKSRYGRLQLRAEVKQGTPAGYYVTSSGKRIGAVASSLPEAAVTCAAAKKMPKPDTPASSCNGQRFTVVIAHAGDQRFALLYGEDGGSWHFCSAGQF